MLGVNAMFEPMFAKCCDGSSMKEKEMVLKEALHEAPIAEDLPVLITWNGKDKLAGKPMMQTALDMFARKAVAGCTCAFLVEHSGERYDAKYSVDSSLQRMRLDLLEAGGPFEGVSWRTTAIQDIYLIDDGEDCFPPAVLSKVPSKERERLVMMAYLTDPGDVQHACLLLDSIDSRDALMESLRIICIHGR
mmetsp:Transcript_64164/g.165172  ORF Transcript_64164/g.165172 Transcript_64164/m.165172 type:complete len:191 (+) Transcript_64164:74-646(+)